MEKQKRSETDRKWTRGILFHLSCIGLLMAPAFYNGFPLVYSDTGTYILSGMDLMVPRDRPVFYGLFIRATSLGFSLWPVVFVQALLVHYTLFRLFETLFAREKRRLYFGSLFFLSVCTGLGWYTSQLMPDIFSAVAVLCVPLLILRQRGNTAQFVLTAIIFMGALVVHGSNWLIVFLVLAMLGIFVWTRKLAYKKNHALVALMLFLTIPIAGLVNMSIGGSFEIGRGGHVYLIGKMHDSGVLQAFLDNECASSEYEFCAFRDSLPADSRELLWDDKSPIAQLGGWQASNSACWEVITGIASHPKYLGMYLYNSTYSSISQLFQNDIGSGLVSDWYSNPDSPPAHVIKKYFPQERLPYLQSRQNTNLWGQGLDFSLVNTLAHLVLLSSVAFLIYAWVTFRKLPKDLVLVLLVLVAGVVFNAIVTASLANIYDRLQARVSWLIVLMAVFVLLAERRRFMEQLRGWLNGNFSE